MSALGQKPTCRALVNPSAWCQKQTSTAPRKILWITKDGVAPHPVDGAKIG
jgi:hypothetical protein